MATAQSSFIIKRLDGFGGPYVDSQYLGNAYETGKPHMLENTLTKIFSSESRFLTGGKNLLGMTGAKSYGTMEIDTEVYRWRLQGAEEKSMRSLENLEAGNTTPGINGSLIRLKGDLDFYTHPEVLLPEDNAYPMQIVDGPIPDGTGFIYTLKLQGDNPSLYLPPSLLDAGREFSKGWTSTPSEANRFFGNQQYPNSFLLESQVSAFAQSIQITDKAWRDSGRLNVEFMYTDANGKTRKVDRFLPMAEAKMWDELYMSMEAQMVYGVKQTQPGKDKYWIKTGPGLRQQLKDSWIQYYNGALTVSMLKDYLMDIFFARADERDRKVVAMTGTQGSLMFHDALSAIANGFLTIDTHFIERTQGIAGIETPHLAYGAQFTRYRGPQGVVVDLIQNPMYDNRKYCKQMHPQYPDRPIDSARMTFLDFGTTGGDNNMQMLKVKDTFRWGYVAGTHTPTGPVKGGQAGSKIAGYDLFTEGTAGLLIRDVTRAGELIFDSTY